jgi:hypothetical protein
MKQWIAVVKTTGNVLDIYQDYDTEQECLDHVARTGGWVAPLPSGERSKYWVIDADAKTIGYDKIGQDADTSMSQWKVSMARTDLNTPRWFEDAVTERSVILKPGRVKDNYDEKVRLRGTKP